MLASFSARWGGCGWLGLQAQVSLQVDQLGAQGDYLCLDRRVALDCGQHFYGGQRCGYQVQFLFCFDFAHLYVLQCVFRFYLG